MVPGHMTCPHPSDASNTPNGVFVPLGMSQTCQTSVRQCPSLQDAAQQRFCVPTATRALSMRYDMSDHLDTSSGPLTKVHHPGTHPSHVPSPMTCHHPVICQCAQRMPQTYQTACPCSQARPRTCLTSSGPSTMVHCPGMHPCIPSMHPTSPDASDSNLMAPRPSGMAGMLLSRSSPLLACPCDRQWCVRTIGHILDLSTQRVHGASSLPPNDVSEPSDPSPGLSSRRGPTSHDMSLRCISATACALTCPPTRTCHLDPLTMVYHLRTRQVASLRPQCTSHIP